MHLYKKEEQIIDGGNKFIGWCAQNLNFTFYELEPNPVRDHVNISYELCTAGSIEISLLNSNKGKIVIIGKHQSEGIYKIRYNTSKLEPGLYIINIMSGDELETREMTVIK